MNPMRSTTAVLAVWVLSAVACAAQDDAITKLKTYDFQNRAPVAAVRVMIQESLSDKTRLAQIEQGLVAVLEDPSATFAGKQETCRLLWPIGTVRSVPALAKMLGDEKLGDAARYALERNPDSAAGKALRDALKTTSGKGRIGIINSLGDRMDAAAVSDLKPLATDKDTVTAEASIVALGKIGTESSLQILQSLPDRSLPTTMAILRCADRLAATGKKSSAERVYLDLAAPGQLALAQETALRGLVQLKSSKATEVALAGLKSTDVNVQVAAATVCAALTDAAVTKPAIAAWPTLAVPAQVALLAGMAERRESAAGPLAEQAIQSTDETLRGTGIRAAARISGARAVPMLAKITTQGSKSDKQIARDMLAMMPGKDADQAILQLARQGEPPIRVALVGVLADRGTPEARAELLQAAQGTDEKQASDALKALGKSVGKTEYPQLVKVLATTGSESVRDAAGSAVVTAAHRLGDPNQASAPVVAALSGASVPTRVALIAALAEIGGDAALAEVTKATTAPEPEVKAAALTALAETWGDSRPLPTLLVIAKTDTGKSARVQALRGYFRLIDLDTRIPAPEKVTRIQEAMGIAERPEEKRQALSVLRDCRVPSAVELAAKSLEDPSVFDEAADAVLYLAAPQKKGNTNQGAVKGPATTAALDRVIQLAKDDSLKAKAQKAR